MRTTPQNIFSRATGETPANATLTVIIQRLNHPMQQLRGAMRILATLVILCAAMVATTATATTIQLRLPNDSVVRAKTYAAHGHRLAIWLVSETGFQDHYPMMAKQAARLGLEIWMVDLFATNGLNHSAANINTINPWQLRAVLGEAKKHSPKEITVVAKGRASLLVLRALSQWRQANEDDTRVKGAILLNPELTYGTPPVGQSPDYAPETYAVAEPLFVLQSEYAPNYWHRAELLDALAYGGQAVLYDTMAGVRADFLTYRRTNDREQGYIRQALPALLSQAAAELEKTVRLKAPDAREAKPAGIIRQDIPLNIQPLKQPVALPDLALPDRYGRTWDIEKAVGKVKIVTFWTHWCTQCAIQMNKLETLYQANREALEIIAVHIGEGTHAHRLQQREETFPILQGDIALATRLNLRAIPTTLIAGADNQVRYAFFGTPKWDDPIMQALINRLLAGQ